MSGPIHVSFLSAAEQVLRESSAPLHVSAITARALQKKLVSTDGQTPVATMRSQLAVSLKRKGDASPFVQVAPGTYGLREWGGEYTAPNAAAAHGVKVPHYPTYAALRALLPALVGLERDRVTALRSTLMSLAGTVTANLDWTDPDSWIVERLDGAHRLTADRVWVGSGKTVNPRHFLGHWLLASGYGLVNDDTSGKLAITQLGHDFIGHHEGNAVREIDLVEGLLSLLALVAEHAPASTGELLEPWMRHLEQASQVRSETTGRSYLYYRLKNLVARGYLERRGQEYGVTSDGLRYLKAAGMEHDDRPDTSAKVWDLIREQHQAVRAAMREQLGSMDPIGFEHLIKQLLIAMGYTDVEVTAPSGDKGVDVIGQIELGITSVREVVQAKRHKNNVQRRVLDELRGSLHRFNAMRGTIITVGDFAKGTREAAFERGAAPVTLIHGEKLIDLLIEKGIGVRRKTVELLELDPEAFVGLEEEQE